MKVTVFGIGYVGLVQSAVLAAVGHNVLCIDIDDTKIQKLKKGSMPIFETDLQPLITQNYQSGRLQFSSHPEEGVQHGLIQFITVGTPVEEDGSVDLKNVIAVSRTIAEHMQDRKIVLNKSTVPVGTTEYIRQLITATLQDRGVNFLCEVVSNPEFLTEGTAVNDCMNPDRIIIGTDNANIINLLCELYQPFNHHHNRMLFMDIRSAELTKYTANCMLATKISFMNEISNLAERLGADIDRVRQGIGADSRIGHSFIYPGCGYGGSCLPKDMKALIRTSQDIGYHPGILKAVVNVNSIQKYKLSTIVKHHFKDNLQGKIFALWGLSFKPNTNDMREASSRVLMEELWKEGAVIQAFDPAAFHEIQRIYGLRDDLKIMENKELALQNADGLIICTEWQHFHSPDFAFIKQTLKNPVIFDGRNIYDPDKLKEYGFIYYAIGRGESVRKKYD
ncbi:UDP-glucose dehydrogenase family protein [Candidatus Erwinia haradaeae]|uniref:UDP-glucose 6-dehydrogenase n=1 Tax=Candidatus Erwinia haradaeae TaxID=1922217 RepID=A0A451D9M2_9GAMM|nr:UDP-glucose/GDP-mannose dehydrogenase family protein [Candidatus Erwinia haradaeae]VFP82965.1 UDP-glucose 6-dehydrogenase [Candidatus Erwinia haradaeae]